MNRGFLRVLLLGACAALAGCDTDTTINGGGDGPDGELDIDSLTLLADSPQLSSDAADVAQGVTLTAIVKDSNNNVVPGATVEFSTSDSGEINVANPAVTDATGRVEAVLTTGGDPRARTIDVTARAGGLSRTVTIAVIGSLLDVSGPTATQFGVPTEYIISLTDAAGEGIFGESVTVSTNPGNTLSATTLTTDDAGLATVTLTPTVAATQLTVTGLGLTVVRNIAVSGDEFTFEDPIADEEVPLGSSQTIRVQWLQQGAPVPDGTIVNFAATRGTLSATSAATAGGLAQVQISSTEAGFSTIVASSTSLSKPSVTVAIEFVSVTPAKIEVQASPAVIATNESSEITAIVRDANNNLVKNVTVDFSLSDLTGGSLSSPTAVTNSQGLARVNYNATSQTSSTDGVQVTGKVRGSNDPDQERTAVLTVGARAVGVTVGIGSQIIPKNQSTYQYPVTILITDSAGHGVPDADFDVTVVPIEFYKGTFAAVSATCPNEDVNLNDIIDPSEDADSDGVLDPGRVASVVVPDELDDDGSAQVLVVYPKDRGLFVTVRVIAVARVAGTEATGSLDFLLPIAQSDVNLLPGISPYGTSGSCADND